MASQTGLPAKKTTPKDKSLYPLMSLYQYEVITTWGSVYSQSGA